MFKKLSLFIILLFSFQALNLDLAYAEVGMSTPFGKILIENLQIGKTYSLKKLINLPLRIKNKSSHTLTINIEPVYPLKNQLEQDFESIPHLSWIKIENSTLTIPSQQTGESDIFISIPNNKKYLGKKFIVYFWSHTVKGTGSVALGLKSKVLFTISSTPSLSAKGGAFQETEETYRGDYQFNVLPYDIIVKNIKLGKVYDIKKLTKQSIKIINPNNQDFTYEITSLNVEDAGTQLKEGYLDTPNAGFLTLNKTTVFVPAKSEKEVKMYLSFPDEKEYAGKKYMFIIQTKLLSKHFHLKVFSRLYVTTRN